MKVTLRIILFGFIATLTIMPAQAMRWYSPSTGKWFSRDPVDEPGFTLLRQNLPTEMTAADSEEDAGLIGLNPADISFQSDDADTPGLSDALRSGDLNIYAFTKNDPIDNVDALGLEVYIQAHRVAAGFNHSKVTMIVACGSRWIGDPRFHPMPGQDGQYYATIGAGPIHHLLVSGINRPRDVQLWRNIFSSRVPAPGGTSEDDFIGQLLTANSRYPNNLPYAWFPTRNGRHYNSNGYASGILLFVTGSMPPRPPRTPGFRHPVPGEDFR